MSMPRNINGVKQKTKNKTKSWKFNFFFNKSQNIKKKKKKNNIHLKLILGKQELHNIPSFPRIFNMHIMLVKRAK